MKRTLKRELNKYLKLLRGQALATIICLRSTLGCGGAHTPLLFPKPVGQSGSIRFYPTEFAAVTPIGGRYPSPLDKQRVGDRMGEGGDDGGIQSSSFLFRFFLVALGELPDTYSPLGCHTARRIEGLLCNKTQTVNNVRPSLFFPPEGGRGNCLQAVSWVS